MRIRASRRCLVALLALVAVGCSTALFSGRGGSAAEVAASASTAVGWPSAMASSDHPPRGALTAGTATPTPRPERTAAFVVTVVVVDVTPPPSAPDSTGTRLADQATPAIVAPDHLSIPAIGLETDVVALGWSAQMTENGPMSVWDELPLDAAAWLRNSAMPGQGSNVVITGHHNVGAEVFRDLERLAEGDRVVLTAAGNTYTYAISERAIVPERDVSEEQRLRNGAWMKPATCDRLTLVTCWPYETNTHRLILVADPVAGTP